MKKLFFTLALLAVSFIATAQTRVVVLSDFPPVDVVPGGMGFGDAHKRSDSDDVQSMVRFLLYTNEFDVEGLVATSATFANQANKQNIHDILYLVSDALGISQADEPWQESWGGKFVQLDTAKNHWYDAPGGGANVYKWRKAVQDDFAKRADWMLP